jgi:hypothetical protein
METKINKAKIEVDDVEISSDGDTVEFLSKEKSIIIKCKNEEIEIMNKDGTSNFKDLFINNVKLEDKFSKLALLNDLFKKVKRTELFIVRKAENRQGDLKVTYRMHDSDIDRYGDYDVGIDDGKYYQGFWPYYKEGDYAEGFLINPTINKTSYGSEYIVVKDKKASVIQKDYLVSNSLNKLRLATNDRGENKIKPPIPGFKYKLIFSNFESVEQAQFVVDGGTWKSPIFDGKSTCVFETVINEYIEVYINSTTIVKNGRVYLGSSVENEARMVCSLLLLL